MLDFPVYHLVALILASLCTIPALFQTSKQFPGSKDQSAHSHEGLCEDEDSIASDSTLRFGKGNVPQLFILVCSFVGLLLSAIAIQQVSRDIPLASWLSWGIWVSVTVQSFVAFLERSPTKRYELRLYTALTCFFLVVASILPQTASDPHNIVWDKLDSVPTHLKIAQVFVAILTIVANLSLRRRPQLSKGDVPVDSQYSTSFIKRYSYQWCYGLLRLAKVKGRLDLEDLPTLHHSACARSLQEHFQDVMGKHDLVLWKTIFIAHWSTFLQQYTLSMLQSAAQLSPQFAMYSLLKVIEVRQTGDAPSTTGLLWAIGLGASLIISAWIETQCLWIMWSRLVICIRSELMASIFVKVLRSKDVKGISVKDSKSPSFSQIERSATFSKLSKNDRETNVVASNSDGDDTDAHLAQQSQVSVINLVGVDTKKVTDFVGASYMIPSSVCKLFISITFIYSLIGWESVLAGLAVLLVFTPFNLYFSNVMNKVQSRIMRTRDEKMAIINEALRGIRQIKFVASEHQWLEKVREKRSEELRWQWYSFLLRTALVGVWALGPVMISAIALSVHTLLRGTLSPSVAFTTIAVLGQIEGSLAIIPKLILQMLEAAVSATRIGQYLTESEGVCYTEAADTVAFTNTSIAWPTNLAKTSLGFSLRAINVSFPPKELSIISGKTGSGKSLLLATIIGEGERLSGTISVPKLAARSSDDNANPGNWIIPQAMAFVAQIPWIENASIKDNILFGIPYEGKRYALTLTACALTKDLDCLPDGDQTDVGAGGINLSGGQKWRISFARALYSRAGILVLDDIFSAVDTNVGSYLFNEALCGELGEGRTRILVTHHKDICMSKAKYYVVLGDGGVLQAEYLEDLADRKRFVEVSSKGIGSASNDSLHFGMDSVVHDFEAVNQLQDILRLEEGSRRPDSGEVVMTGKERGPKAAGPKKFVEDEKRDTGSVRLSTYGSYINAAGGFGFMFVVVLAHLGYMASILGRSWWITVWTRWYANDHDSGHAFVLLNSPPQHSIFNKEKTIQSPGLNEQMHLNSSLTVLWAYVDVYLGLSVLICFLFVVKFFSVLAGSIKASRVLFEGFSNAIFHAPLRWLDTTPTGRILNRFTADFNVIDESMADGLGFFMNQVFQLTAILVAGVLVSPLEIVAAAILISISVYLARLYLPGIREVKRIESVTRSPIFEQLESAMVGIATIRAFGRTDDYMQRMLKRIDDHARATWYRYLFDLWMILRLNLIGAVFATFVAVVIVWKERIDGSLAGFALSFALQYTVAVEFTIRQYSSMQLSMNSTERVLEYLEMETEDISGADVPASWPSEGVIECENLMVGYTPDQSVLKGLSFKSERNQRIGVVGRTGAGKSTLALALFRFLNASAGRIIIDGIDISTIKLADLRSRLAIVPQDPVLFSGSVRSNLDPFKDYADEELRYALARLHIDGQCGNVGASTQQTDTVKNGSFDSLSSPISEGGYNLSQGQRQLLCLARATLSRRKIIVMDEATSSVDKATDMLIQRSIRECFQDCTMIVIAHRLSTVADFDKILVLSEGRVVEFEEPKVLMERKGFFWEMVQQSGDRPELEASARSRVSP